jgi:hypothetical protein
MRVLLPRVANSFNDLLLGAGYRMSKITRVTTAINWDIINITFLIWVLLGYYEKTMGY